MKQVNKNRLWSALGMVLIASMLGQTAAYADRDDRHDRGQRQEQRWDRGHDRGHGDRQYRQQDRRWDRGQRPMIVQNVHYHFRDGDRLRLRDNYHRHLQVIAHDHHRPYFVPGHVMQHAYRPHITPVPVHVLRTLPPPPPGYVIGYYQGYNVVYDPATYVILSAIDLLSR